MYTIKIQVTNSHHFFFVVLEYRYIKVLLGKSWLNWTRSCQINAYKEVRFVHLMIIMNHKFMYRFNWIIIPWYITFITKQNQQSLALELLKLCSIVYLVMYKYGFPSCSITFQSSIFKCSEEFDSSSFHHYLVRTLLHVFWYYYITLLQIHIHYHIE